MKMSPNKIGFAGIGQDSCCRENRCCDRAAVDNSQHGMYGLTIFYALIGTGYCTDMLAMAYPAISPTQRAQSRGTWTPPVDKRIEDAGKV